MKNYLIFAMILATGLTAYPQATRSAKESKSEKSGSRTETTHRSTVRTDTKSHGQATATESRKATVSAPQRVRTTERPRTETATRTQPPARNQQAVRNESVTRTYERPQTTRPTNPGARQDNQQARRSVETIRPQDNTDRRNNNEFNRGNGGSNRTYREGNGSFTRDDGKVFRHQNDEVFKSHKYRLDFDNYENLRRSDEFRRDRRDYDNWYNHRRIRPVIHIHPNYVPLAWEIRRDRYYHRMPYHMDLLWTPLLFHRFMYYYPTHLDWTMEFGSPIETITAYEAANYAGTVRQVYGKVEEVYYSPEDENYILYVGGPFPYHDLSIVIPRHIARNISLSPKWYFENEYVWVVGLINMWEGKPEIIVRDEDQLRKY